MVNSKIVKKEIPLLLLIVLLTGYLLLDNSLTLFEGVILLVSFFALVLWSVYTALKSRGDSLESEMDIELKEHSNEFKTWSYLAYFWTYFINSKFRILVWGAVGVAVEFGVSDLIIGLTIVCLEPLYQNLQLL